VIFLTGLPIAYYAATYGVDIDLLTRGAGFGYIGSTVTSLIYASFTFLFFAIEAAILSLALELWFGVPLFIGYVISSVVVIPLVTHGITFISRFQLWTQPVWIALHILPFIFIALTDSGSFEGWTHYGGHAGADARSFNLLTFGAASTVAFSLIAQIGEQVDFLRFLPPRDAGRPGPAGSCPGRSSCWRGRSSPTSRSVISSRSTRPPSRRRCTSSRSSRYFPRRRSRSPSPAHS
jgi:purine-cytosine permease-like protein